MKIAVRIEDSKSNFFIFLYLILEFRIRVQHDVICHGHTITYHKEYCKRFQNNNIILYINSI